MLFIRYFTLYKAYIIYCLDYKDTKAVWTLVVLGAGAAIGVVVSSLLPSLARLPSNAATHRGALLFVALASIFSAFPIALLFYSPDIAVLLLIIALSGTFIGEHVCILYNVSSI